MDKKTKKRKNRNVQLKHEPVVRVFASSLRELRIARGLTQAELARKSNINPNYIGRLERATCAPGIDMIEKLATALNSSIHELLPDNSSDPLPLLKEQVEKRIASIIGSADAATMGMLAQLLTFVDSDLRKRR